MPIGSCVVGDNAHRPPAPAASWPCNRPTLSAKSDHQPGSGIDHYPLAKFRSTSSETSRNTASYHYLRQPDVLERFRAACHQPEGTSLLPWDLLIVDEA